jgi:hypothetical protein
MAAATAEIAFGLLLALHCPRAALQPADGYGGRRGRPIPTSVEANRVVVVFKLTPTTGLLVVVTLIVGAATLVSG